MIKESQTTKRGIHIREIEIGEPELPANRNSKISVLQIMALQVASCKGVYRKYAIPHRAFYAHSPYVRIIGVRAGHPPRRPSWDHMPTTARLSYVREHPENT